MQRLDLREHKRELFDATTARKLDTIVNEWAMASYYVRHDGKGRAVLAGPPGASGN